MNREHGGNWAAYLQQYGTMPLDFSASISPLGLPESVRKAVINALSIADRYPDPACSALTAALAVRLGVTPGQILWGNGVSDLLYRMVLALRPASALVTAPTFSEYAAALSLSGCRVERYALRPEQDFQVTQEFLNVIQPGLNLLILCQPNNPTGITVPLALMEEILRRCEETGTVLAVDESFLSLTDCWDVRTLTCHVATHPQLLLFQSFTKSHAMAGLRLGYALSGNRALLEAMDRAGAPWSVSSVAQAAGLAALEVDLEPVRAVLRVQRPLLRRGLEALGCQVWPGEANYLLLRAPCADLAERLEKHGILIRDFRSFPGLGPGYYRVAVRNAEENQSLLKGMGEVLHG